MTAKTVLVALRLEPELLKRVDRFARKFEAENPGVQLDRTAAVRVLLLQSLAQIEKRGAARKKR